jgi:hypothetical protein
LYISLYNYIYIRPKIMAQPKAVFYAASLTNGT